MSINRIPPFDIFNWTFDIRQIAAGQGIKYNPPVLPRLFSPDRRLEIDHQADQAADDAAGEIGQQIEAVGLPGRHEGLVQLVAGTEKGREQDAGHKDHEGRSPCRPGHPAGPEYEIGQKGVGREVQQFVLERERRADIRRGKAGLDEDGQAKQHHRQPGIQMNARNRSHGIQRHPEKGNRPAHGKSGAGPIE
ncbi:hypothetical protein DESC_610409 [Desulfosarcina cetonica]|nr:hypothetical protein DESC_610409 [Desulfosarcina cetonica]